MVFSASNIAKEWCADAGTASASAATAARPKALRFIGVLPVPGLSRFNRILMQPNAGGKPGGRPQLTEVAKRTSIQRRAAGLPGQTGRGPAHSRTGAAKFLSARKFDGKIHSAPAA